MGEPRFRRTVFAVALLHLALIGALVWWSTREVRVQQAKAEISWFSPAQFSSADIVEEETERTVSRVVQNLTTAVFLPVY